MRELTFTEAAREGLDEEMARQRPDATPVNTFRFGAQTITTRVNVMVPREARSEVVDVTASMYEPVVGHEMLEAVFEEEA